MRSSNKRKDDGWWWSSLSSTTTKQSIGGCIVRAVTPQEAGDKTHALCPFGGMVIGATALMSHRPEFSWCNRWIYPKELQAIKSVYDQREREATA